MWRRSKRLTCVGVRVQTDRIKPSATQENYISQSHSVRMSDETSTKAYRCGELQRRQDFDLLQWG